MSPGQRDRTVREATLSPRQALDFERRLRRLFRVPVVMPV